MVAPFDHQQLRKLQWAVWGILAEQFRNAVPSDAVRYRLCETIATEVYMAGGMIHD